jgi:hypothetical protein
VSDRILTDYRQRVDEYLEWIQADPPDWVGADAQPVARWIHEFKELGRQAALDAGIQPAARSPVAEAYWRVFELLNP